MKEAHILARACHAYIEFITKITKVNKEKNHVFNIRNSFRCYTFRLLE
jgi:hypothetical protein